MKRILSRSLLLVIAVLLAALSATRCFAADSIYHFYPGVHLSREHPLNRKQLRRLLDDWQFLTGFSEVQFDSDNNLILGDRSRINNGSALARDLFVRAVDSADSFTVEQADHSPAIAFAQLESLASYGSGTGARRQDWHVRIDFADFNELRGASGAIASFSPGIAVFHELIHAIIGYPDPLEPADQLGQCERHLNRIRVQLGLSERQHYYSKNRFATLPESPARIYQASLMFVREEASTNKRQEFLLTFNLERVFDVSKAKPLRVSQSDTLARRAAN